jgi:hypothetical protein
MDETDEFELPEPEEVQLVCPICYTPNLLDVSPILLNTSPAVQLKLKQLNTKLHRTPHTPSKIKDFVCLTCGFEMPKVNLINPKWHLIYN